MENLENQKCVDLLFQALKKTGIFNSKPGKRMNIITLMFPDSLFKMSFTKIINLYMLYLHCQHKQCDSKSN